MVASRKERVKARELRSRRTAVARTGRFFASVLIARAVTLLIARWTRERPWIEVGAWAVFWLGFYAFYFAAFGW
jgi:hypothetical protein